MPRVFVTGGSGLIGSYLIPRLREAGHAVAVLTRGASDHRNGVPYFHWNAERGEFDENALEYAEAVIHLAGENIAAGRWTSRRKQRILTSRVKTAEFLLERLKQHGKPPKVFLSASAVGYYGMQTTPRIFQEDDPPAGDFLAMVCRQWEAAASRFSELGSRVVILRIGVVLTPRGGALARMALPVRFGLGSPLGSGNQWVPWIHIHDLTEMFLLGLANDTLAGVYNAVAPEPVTNAEFMRTLAQVLGRPFFLPAVPAFLLRMLLGEMADMVLEGSRVSAEKIQHSGFSFQFPRLHPALQDIFHGRS